MSKTAGKQSNTATMAMVITMGLSAAVIVYWGVNYPSWLTFDDAFITYRYADNLRRGLGLVYNSGEWVLGTTTPLYALLLAGLGLAVPDLQLLGHWLGVFFWVTASWAAIALLKQEGWPCAGLIAGLLLAFQPFFLLSLGMETSLVIALMLWVAWAWLGQRKRLAVVLAVALILTRQDSTLWLIFLGLEIWRREKTLPWREAVAVSALVLPWFVFSFWRYGSFLPNSATAKFGQNELMAVGGQQPFWRELWLAATSELSKPITFLFAALPLFGLGVIASRVRHLWWLAGWTILYVASYLWLGVVSFPWYFVPPLTVAALIISIGGGLLLGGPRYGEGEPAGQPLLASSPWLSRMLQVLGVLALAALVGGQFTNMRSFISLPEGPAAYVSTGQWLAQNTPEEASVVTIEIGIIGYYSQRPIVDTMGLVSPDMTDHQLGWVETLVYALNAYQPDYALTLPHTGWDAVVNQWWFQDDYKEVAHFGNVTIYELQKPDKEMYEVEVAADYVDGLGLRGVSFVDQELRPGADLAAWLNVVAQSAQPPDLSIKVHLVDAESFKHVIEAQTYPFGGLYKSDRWQPGDNLRIPIRLPIPADLDPGTYRLGVVMVDPARRAGLPLLAAPDRSNPDIQVGWLWFGKPEPSPQESNLAEVQALVKWHNGIELTSLALPDYSLSPGDRLPVQLKWRSSQEIERDFTVFVHLVDGDGQIVAQHDQRPFNGRWPTQVWQPGDVYTDLHEIHLPVTIPASSYDIRIGLYDYIGREQLSVGAIDYWESDRSVIVAE